MLVLTAVIHYCISSFSSCFAVNADDRESNMVFNSKSNEVEDEGNGEILHGVESESSDGASSSKPNMNFFATIDWQEKEGKSGRNGSLDISDDDDDDFESLRFGEAAAADKSTSQAHDFFSERQGEGTRVTGGMDLFDMKLSADDGLSENFFTLEDTDSDGDEPGISGESNNVDLLNLGSNFSTNSNQEAGRSSQDDSYVRMVDDMGVDLLNLSPGELPTRA